MDKHCPTYAVVCDTSFRTTVLCDVEFGPTVIPKNLLANSERPCTSLGLWRPPRSAVRNSRPRQCRVRMFGTPRCLQLPAAPPLLRRSPRPPAPARMLVLLLVQPITWLRSPCQRGSKKSCEQKCAPAGNRTRVESMATIHYTTKPLAHRRTLDHM